MKTSLKQYLTEGQTLPHWPKTKEELIAVYRKCMVSEETGEVMMPIYYEKGHQFESHNNVEFNDDLTVSVKGYKSDDYMTIAPWMLVNNQLPFPFKEANSISFLVERDCKLKSFAGFPRKCKSVDISFHGMDNSVKNFIGGPEYVEEAFGIKDSGIESMDGFPKMGDDCSIFLQTDGLKDFSKIPKNVKNLTIAESKHFTHEDFKHLPESADIIAFSSLPNLHSLHNIHKYVKHLRVLGIFNTKIQYAILGVAMINGLETIDPEFFDVNSDDSTWPADGVEEVVNKYIGTHDIFGFQEDLTDLGLTELAKI